MRGTVTGGRGDGVSRDRVRDCDFNEMLVEGCPAKAIRGERTLIGHEELAIGHERMAGDREGGGIGREKGNCSRGRSGFPSLPMAEGRKPVQSGGPSMVLGERRIVG